MIPTSKQAQQKEPISRGSLLAQQESLNLLDQQDIPLVFFITHDAARSLIAGAAQERIHIGKSLLKLRTKNSSLCF